MGAVERFCDRAMLLERGRDGRASASRTRSRAPTTSSTSAGSCTTRPRATATATSAACEIDGAWFEERRRARHRDRARASRCDDRASRCAFHERDRGPDLRGHRCATRSATRLRARRRVARGRDRRASRRASAVDGALRVRRTGSRRAATRSRRRSRATAAGADALDLREDLLADRARPRTTAAADRDLPHAIRDRSARERRRRDRAPPRPVGRRRATSAASASLTWTLAVTDLKLRFFGSALGYVWTLARPLLFFGVALRRVHRDRRASATTSRLPASTCSFALVLFTFFAEITSTLRDARSSTRENLLRKMRFPRMVIPLSVALTALFNLGHDAGRGVHLRARQRRSSRAWSWLELIPLIAAAGVLRHRRGDAALARSTSATATCSRSGRSRIQMLFYASPVLYVATLRAGQRRAAGVPGQPARGDPDADAPRGGRPDARRPRPTRSAARCGC